MLKMLTVAMSDQKKILPFLETNIFISSLLEMDISKNFASAYMYCEINKRIIHILFISRQYLTFKDPDTINLTLSAWKCFIHS